MISLVKETLTAWFFLAVRIYVFLSGQVWSPARRNHEKKNICGKSGSALKHIQLEKKQIHAQKTPITLFLYDESCKKKSIPIILQLCSHCIPACSK